MNEVASKMRNLFLAPLRKTVISFHFFLNLELIKFKIGIISHIVLKLSNNCQSF
jgi:hypothetical protein